jgi:hypothetical protein
MRKGAARPAIPGALPVVMSYHCSRVLFDLTHRQLRGRKGMQVEPGSIEEWLCLGIHDLDCSSGC